MPDEPRADAQLYQQAVGSLQYASVGTRMDITYAVGRLSQHLINPTIRHWNAVLRVFRYLRGTTDYSLVFKLGSEDARLEGFTNADYASAQVSALQAIAVALVRLAEAVESLRS